MMLKPEFEVYPPSYDSAVMRANMLSKGKFLMQWALDHCLETTYLLAIYYWPTPHLRAFKKP